MDEDWWLAEAKIDKNKAKVEETKKQRLKSKDKTTVTIGL